MTTKQTLSLVTALTIGALGVYVTRKYAYPRINIKNVDWEKENFEYSVNGGPTNTQDFGNKHSLGSGNINNKIGLYSVLSDTVGGISTIKPNMNNVNHVFTVVDTNTGKSSTAFIDIENKKIVYS